MRLNFFRKLIIFFRLAAKCILIFNNPKKKDVIFYDCLTAKLLPEILPYKASYFILSTRVLNIKEIYITKKIVIYILKNFFKRSIKQNYLIALILSISPKIVITRTDNSIDFHITSKALKDKFRFIAIQNANRGDTVYTPESKTKDIFIPEFFCFSKYDELLHKKKKCKIEKYKLIGSIYTSLFLEQIKEKRIKLDQEKYDVCLISEPHPIRSGDFSHVPKFEEAVGKVAKYTHELCKRKKLSLIFCGQGEPGNEMAEMEKLFYEKFLKEYNFQINVCSRDNFPTYRNMFQSKIIIGHASTVLREAFAFEKKVLCCNFTNHPDIIFPSKGICQLTDDTYEAFEARVEKILNIDKSEYFRNLEKNKNFILSDNSINSVNLIKKEISQNLDETAG